ncbi:MAG: LysR family transcriptional regulator [Pseudomonadota bacterium]|nr:LysR family transcriptional regulator [Pseudomonadota bacterium]
MDKLVSMRVFSAVAKNGSFSKAAKKLSISKAMVSKHIKNLENSLSVRLFNRTTRKLNLTDAGSSYYEKVNIILSEIDETESAISQLNSEPKGKLKVMAQPSFGAFHLSRALSLYLKKYTEVTVNLELSHRIPDLVEENIDLAFHVGELNDSMYVSRRIASARRVICASPEYIKKNGMPKKPEDLLNHNCLIYMPRNDMGKWEFLDKGRRKKIKVTGDIQCNSGDALRVASIQSRGITQLPTYMVGLDIQAGRLEAVHVDFEPEKQPIYCIYNHRKYVSAKIKTFIDFIYDLYQPDPYWNEWT